MNIRFGIISDPQYSDIEDHKGRQYRGSLEKLESAIDELNTQDLDFVVQLGDLIDHDFESFKAVMKVWDKLKHPSYHVLGNHDFCVDDSHKGEVLNTLHLSLPYYSVSKRDFRFIFLNGNGLSFNAFKEGSDKLKESKEYWAESAGESEWWNGAIDQEQLCWLKEELSTAESSGQKVIIFCHYPLLGEPRFQLWNSKEVRALLECFKNVKVWMNGHFHEGSYEFYKSIHYINMKGMVQHEECTYSIGEVSGQELIIKGYGSEESRILEF